MIPRIVHQFWDTPDIPEEVQDRIAIWRSFHPDWTHILWNDESAASFIETQFGARAVRCFNACTIPAMRSDILRVAAALVVGGVYLDADALCAGPLDVFFDESDCVLVFVQKNSRHLHNDMFGVAPRHFFFERVWQRILDNIEETPPQGVSLTTGPGCFQSIWRGVSKRERSGMQLLEKRQLAPKLTFPRLKSDRPHWREQMKLGRIVDFARADQANAAEVE